MSPEARARRKAEREAYRRSIEARWAMLIRLLEIYPNANAQETLQLMQYFDGWK